MSITIYYILCALLSLLVLQGISMMSKVETAVKGNTLSAVSLFLGVVLTLVFYGIFSVGTIYLFILVGSIIGFLLAKKVKMIEMPQLVALLNGVGGAASAFVGILSFVRIGSIPSNYETFTSITAILAVVIGLITLVGSLVAAAKLHKVLPQHPVIWPKHQLIASTLLVLSIIAVVLSGFAGATTQLLFNPYFIILLAILASSLFGYTFAIRVGGADMPITISLLNSLSGVAGAIAGMAIGDILLIAVGGIVGASGLFLTQIMCRSMNRDLMTILLGKTAVVPTKQSKESQPAETADDSHEVIEETIDYSSLLKAKEVIIVPGYGMALAQAQHLVKQLADQLSSQGANVRFAIHPVAGRMPGHMNVLLAEADVPYDQLHEMEIINPDFKQTDLVVVVGANDVLNPAARDAEGTPIHGMPILNVDQAKEVIICNFDTKPGYAGVDNPLYHNQNTKMLLGDAKESLQLLLQALTKTQANVSSDKETDYRESLNQAEEIIIVPGYGMALAQAQHIVKLLADRLSNNGAKVRFAIHPVAGRMPGHMNVLLAEADIPYDELIEMELINSDFSSTDLVIVIGANDVINPAARDAEGTPIYGMPILNVDQAKEVIICNFDTEPGYAGVDNPLYKKENVTLILGDAKDSLQQLLSQI